MDEFILNIWLWERECQFTEVNIKICRKEMEARPAESIAVGKHIFRDLTSCSILEDDTLCMGLCHPSYSCLDLFGRQVRPLLFVVYILEIQNCDYPNCNLFF